MNLTNEAQEHVKKKCSFIDFSKKYHLVWISLLLILIGLTAVLVSFVAYPTGYEKITLNSFKTIFSDIDVTKNFFIAWINYLIKLDNIKTAFNFDAFNVILFTNWLGGALSIFFLVFGLLFNFVIHFYLMVHAKTFEVSKLRLLNLVSAFIFLFNILYLILASKTYQNAKSDSIDKLEIKNNEA